MKKVVFIVKGIRPWESSFISSIHASKEGADRECEKENDESKRTDDDVSFYVEEYNLYD